MRLLSFPWCCVSTGIMVVKVRWWDSLVSPGNNLFPLVMRLIPPSISIIGCPDLTVVVSVVLLLLP